MYELGTRVHWQRGEQVAEGIISACLTGVLNAPHRTVVHTLLVQMEGGALEVVPGSAIRTPEQGERVPTLTVASGVPGRDAGAA